eukprot:2656311-Alexandrium_andersonii.AAC.1
MEPGRVVGAPGSLGPGLEDGVPELLGLGSWDGQVAAGLLCDLRWILSVGGPLFAGGWSTDAL